MSYNRATAFAYLRLSREESKSSESTSIATQRVIVTNYCNQHDITLVKVFSDDGWSGGNFDRPGFQAMMRELEIGAVNMVITKDLSRLGRDMRESSYYAEQFFPEHGIRYIAIADNFDTDSDNVMAPFQFAMNEVYLRDGSRKVRDALKSKREQGEYCCCPPYGYEKAQNKKGVLVPDEMTAPIVKRIFEAAANGDSCRTIAIALTNDGVIPPLKYRVLYRDDFSDAGAAKASDEWNGETVRRLLKNPVYLGHTVLGKTKKASIKSTKKTNVPKENWAITKNTHEPIVSEKLFDLAQANLGKRTKIYMDYGRVRNNIFAGIVFCANCGHALCSSGTVYKGERLKYWYLSCTHKRKDIQNPCTGVSIRYGDFTEAIRQDLNSLIDLSDDEIHDLVQDVMNKNAKADNSQSIKTQCEKAKERIKTIDKIIAKLYVDNAEGKIDDDRMYGMVKNFEKESDGLKATIAELESQLHQEPNADDYEKFFTLAKSYTHIDVLDRDTVLTFIDRIEVGERKVQKGCESMRYPPYSQEIRIFYKFIGEIAELQEKDFPIAADG